MNKKTDLRVIKTERRIKDVFKELIAKKELKKITVTELTKIAEINKGTFYLHYKDIYELYNQVLQETIDETVDSIIYIDEFFVDPEAFIFHFFNSISKICSDNAMMREHEPFTRSSIIQELMDDALKSKIYETQRIPKTEENDIKLSYIFFNLFHFMRQDDAEKKYPVISKMIIADIKNAFSDYD